MKTTDKVGTKTTQRRPPATTPEARENQMIALAVDLAEKQLLEGKASSQVITHFLKLATAEKKIEREILVEQKKLIIAKTAAMESSKRIEELYMKALGAMKSYSGSTGGDEID